MLHDETKRAGPGLFTVACHLPATQGQCDGTITKYSSELTAASHCLGQPVTIVTQPLCSWLLSSMWPHPPWDGHPDFFACRTTEGGKDGASGFWCEEVSPVFNL